MGSHERTELTPDSQLEEGKRYRVWIEETHMDQTFESEATARRTAFGWEFEDGRILTRHRERVTHFQLLEEDE